MPMQTRNPFFFSLNTKHKMFKKENNNNKNKTKNKNNNVRQNPTPQVTRGKHENPFAKKPQGLPQLARRGRDVKNYEVCYTLALIYVNYINLLALSTGMHNRERELEALDALKAGAGRQSR